MKNKIEYIGKGNIWTLLCYILIGLYFGVLIMAFLGVWYSQGSIIKEISGNYTILKGYTVELWPFQKHFAVNHVYFFLLLAAAFGIVNWFVSFWFYQKPITKAKEEVLSELKNLDKMKVIQEESTTK